VIGALFTYYCVKTDHANEAGVTPGIGESAQADMNPSKNNEFFYNGDEKSGHIRENLYLMIFLQLRLQ